MVKDPTIRDIRRTHYQAILNRIFSSQYPGGIRSFCNDCVVAYQGLEKLQLPIPEEEKIANFTLHAWTPDNKELISHLRMHCKTLQEITQQVYADSLKVDYYNATIATRRANLAVNGVNDPLGPLMDFHPQVSQGSPAPIQKQITLLNAQQSSYQQSSFLIRSQKRHEN